MDLLIASKALAPSAGTSGELKQLTEMMDEEISTKVQKRNILGRGILQQLITAYSNRNIISSFAFLLFRYAIESEPYPIAFPLT